jgi:hypothetical protein
MMSESPMGDGMRAGNDFNVVDYRPLLRAALANLERWVVDGIEPPESLVPRLSDGTAAERTEVLATMPAIPGMAVPQVERLRAIPAGLAMGPEQDRGILRWPIQADGSLACYVSAVDEDGNEVAGIRLPEIAAPAGTHVAWNPRHPSTGGEGQAVRFFGSTLPFAVTRAQREASGDPRPSLEERYGDRSGYEVSARKAAEALAEQRFLLPEDVPFAVENAMRRFDAMSARAALGWDQSSAAGA